MNYTDLLSSGGSYVSTSPSVTVVASELKTHSRISTSSDDTYLATLEVAARSLLEKMYKVALVTQSWTWNLNAFPGSVGTINFSVHPVSAITSINYYDSNDDQQLLDSDNYELCTNNRQPKVRPVYGETWPVTYDRFNAVEIIFVAGYGAAAAVPQVAKLAIQELVAYWYENRETVNVGDIPHKMPWMVENLMNTIRLLEFK